jgi:hypothetical protein
MTYFYWFLGLFAVGLAAVIYVFRGTWNSIANEMADHAKTYAIAYTVGGALIFIAAGTQFEQSYYALDGKMQDSMPWAPYVVFFWKPVAAGLTTLVAFLNRSIERAQEVRRNAPTPDNQPAKVP